MRLTFWQRYAAYCIMLRQMEQNIQIGWFYEDVVILKNGCLNPSISYLEEDKWIPMQSLPELFHQPREKRNDINWHSLDKEGCQKGAEMIRNAIAIMETSRSHCI